MKNKYKIGDKFKHKEYGFTGELICIDHWSNLHLIKCQDGEDKTYPEHPFFKDKSFVEYAPDITWKGAAFQIEKKFEKIKS